MVGTVAFLASEDAGFTTGPVLHPDGQVDLDIARQAINAVAAELGVAQ